jgi:hypothetical protein
MNITEPIRNKVAESGIITLDLEPFVPTKDSIAIFDIKPFLFRELILREKDYRAGLQEHDWSLYRGKHVGITCSTDAIIPLWAYMLAASHLQPHAKTLTYGNETVVINEQTKQAIQQSLVAEEYFDKRVILKGCGDVAIPEIAYIIATTIIQPVVKSLMFGEACSTVPIYKQAKTTPKA